MSDTKQSKLQHVEIHIDKDNVEPGAYALLQKVRPQWKQDHVKIETFSEGNLNTLLCCHLESDLEKQDAIVLRVFGSMGPNSKFAMARDQEVMYVQVAAAIKVGQPVYALFKNGIAYRYAPGRTLIGEDITDPEIIRLISVAAARLAYADFSNIEVCNADGDMRPMEKLEASYFKMLETAIFPMIPETLKDPQLNERYKENLKPRNEIIEDFQRMKSHMDKNVPKVLCHNDFHIKNMVYHKETAELSILDYEGMGQSYEGTDIVRNLTLAPSWTLLGWGESKVFDESVLMPYVKEYLKEKFRILGKSPNDISEKDVKVMLWYCQLSWIFFDYFRMIVWLMQIENKLTEKMDRRDKNPLQYAIDNYKRIVPRLDFFFNSQKPE